MYQSQIDSIVLNHLLPRHVETLPLFKARERHLAQHLVATEDVPSQARARCSGIAIAWRDWQAGSRIFKLTHRLDETACNDAYYAQRGFSVEAGDALPPTADCVIAHEHFELLDQTILINPHLQLSRWHQVTRPGSECQSGDILVPDGQRLSPFEWALASLDAKAATDDIGVLKAHQLLWFDWQEDFDDSNEMDLSEQLYKQRLIEATLQDFQLDMHSYQSVCGTISQLVDQVQSRLDDHVLIVVSGINTQDQLERSSKAFSELGFANHLGHLPQRSRQLLYFGSNPTPATLCLSGSRVFDAMILLRRYMIPFMQASIQARSQPFAQNAFARILNPECLPSFNSEAFLPANVSCNDEGQLEALIDLACIDDPWRLRKCNAFIDMSHRKDPAKSAVPVWFWRPQCF